MKTENFERSDGTEGTIYKLEDENDKVIAQFSKPVVNTKGKYDNYSIGVKIAGDEDGEVIYLRLTKTQYEDAVKFGDLTGKTICGRVYENKYGKQVGLTIN